jgi:hypothetical protein
MRIEFHTRNKPDIERFMARIKEDSGCWIWIAKVDEDGYGRFYTRGKMHIASRVSWCLFNKVDSIPEGMMIDHICRVRRCVNPSHLRLVTPRQNALENSCGVTAVKALMTHCDKGHELSGENLLHCALPSRICRTCFPERLKIYRMRTRLKYPEKYERKREKNKLRLFLRRQRIKAESAVQLNGQGRNYEP